MKIVITGAGEIGYDLASTLSAEKHDVTVLDREQIALTKVSDSLDVLAIEGNATSVNDLHKTGVSEADILICVTSIDEVNIMSGMIGKRLGAKTVIARVRSNELTEKGSPLSPSDLGIDVIIHPEWSAAQEIMQLMLRSSASDIVNLADNKMQLVGIRLEKDSPIVGKTLSEYAVFYPELKFRIVAIVRRGRTIIPDGSVRLQQFDQVFLLAKTENIKALIKTTGKEDTSLNNIMIAGGSALGAMITQLLCSDKNKSWSVKLIEPDYDIAESLAVRYKTAMILHGNPTDPDLLVTEGIMDMDAFIAVSDDEESNIISCLMAKHLGVKKTVALVSKPDFIPLAQTIGLDAVVNQKASASSEIHRYVRHGHVVSVTELRGINAEVLELRALKGSKITKKPIFKMKFPEGCIIGGVFQNGNVDVVTGKTHINEGDRVIVFCRPETIDSVTKLFN